jgi:hypothetical protein
MRATSPDKKPVSPEIKSLVEKAVTINEELYKPVLNSKPPIPIRPRSGYGFGNLRKPVKAIPFPEK